jgi:hypothetical protein
MALGEQVLEWMLRRLRAGRPLAQDLVLAHDSPLLAEVGTSLDLRGERWRIARVTGELTLRDVLPEADRLIAIVPHSFPPLPMDLAGRAYLRRILDIRAEDVVAAVSGCPCEALVDEALAQAVFDSFEALRGTAGRWSRGELVRTREVRAMLVSAELGSARLDRERDWELLARWIRDGAPSFRAPTIVRSALEEAQPRTGRWLAWALTEGSIEKLCTAGALAASSEGLRLAPVIPGLAESDHAALVDLVDTAVREVWRTSPERAAEVLTPAERVARQVALDAGRHRMLRLPLEAALNRLARECARGTPPDDADIERLRRNLHAPALGASIAMISDLARLSRFLRVAPPTDDERGWAWLAYARRDVAWADLAYRRVRRGLETVEPWLVDPAREVLAAWLRHRDDVNSRFAVNLATNWSTLAGNADPRQPLLLSQVTRTVVRRLIDDGARVLLLVLDGCDLASFLELVESIPADARIGLALPDVRDGVLRDDLAAIGALGVAIAPVPTVTSHARRALFAGEIPGNLALNDTEAAAANATADQRAWARNTALGSARRQLFLKGDLGTAGEPLIEALRRKDVQVIAVVLNGVDDALSSRETTPIPPWSLAALGANAGAIVQTAIEEDWRVIVTADHGHTPYVASDRKVDADGIGHRFSAEPAEGTVMFLTGPLPRQPLHLLSRFGAWFGQQRRGFHGGAGLEEVAVPLAFLGRVRGEQEGRPRAPTWWWSTEEVLAQLPAATPRPVPPPAPPAAAVVGAPATLLDARLGSLTADEQRVVALLAQNQAARVAAIRSLLNKPLPRVVGFMQQLMNKMAELGCPWITVEIVDAGDRLYRYQPDVRGVR